jgi:predicted transcriptional regulator
MTAPFVFSIQPKYVAEIKTRTKRFEFRTRRPSLLEQDIFLIYETKPTSAVVAEAVVGRVISGLPRDVWAQTRAAAGVTRDEFTAYFAGREFAVAIEIADVLVLREPVALPPSMAPPQSWARWHGDWRRP